MPSSYSSLKLQLMATGENSGTWGDITNDNLGIAIEEALVGSADVNFVGANVTLTLTDTNTAQTARNLRLNLVGSSGGARDLIVPAIEKNYIINNGLSDTVTVKNSSGTGVAVPAGKSMWVYNTGTNVVNVTNYITSLSLGSALAIADGGTGAQTVTNARINLLPAYAGNANRALVVNSGATDVVFAAVGDVFLTTAQDLSNKTLITTKEEITVAASAATGTINLDASTSSILYYTSSASANWTLNVRGNASTTLNSLMANGEAITVVFLNTNGATARYQTGFQIDGNAVTPKWQGGTAPTTGNASSIDAYTVTIIKTATSTFTALEAQTRFA